MRTPIEEAVHQSTRRLPNGKGKPAQSSVTTVQLAADTILRLLRRSRERRQRMARLDGR